MIPVKAPMTKYWSMTNVLALQLVGLPAEAGEDIGVTAKDSFADGRLHDLLLLRSIRPSFEE